MSTLTVKLLSLAMGASFARWDCSLASSKARSAGLRGRALAAGTATVFGVFGIYGAPVLMQELSDRAVKVADAAEAVALYAAPALAQGAADKAARVGQAIGSACAVQLPGGRAPSFANPRMSQGLQTICYEQYAVGYSPKTRNALWSAQHLTASQVAAARGLARVNSFHEELALAPADRAELKDFLGSGLDRGHLTPNANFSTPSAQHESFSLANIVPQNPANNQNIWSAIESGTRAYASKNGSVYVITGPLFQGQKLQFLKGRVAIPTQMFKLLYDPQRQAGGVFVVDNADTHVVAWKSIAEFEQLSSYQFGLGNPPLLAMPAYKKPRQDPSTL